MKRKRSAIRKATQAILNVTNNLQESGIEVGHRAIVVGGKRPRLVKLVRKESDEKTKTPGKSDGPEQAQD